MPARAWAGAAQADRARHRVPDTEAPAIAARMALGGGPDLLVLKHLDGVGTIDHELRSMRKLVKLEPPQEHWALVPPH